MQELKTSTLFNLEKTIAAPLLSAYTYPWEVLPKIKDFIIELGKTLPKSEYDLVSENIWIAKTAKIAPSASINPPCIICDGAEIRQCAFIRGSAIIGKNTVIGNSTELKNVIIFDNAQVPHFNYVGDSILGYRAHMGGGAMTSNVKNDKTLVKIKCASGEIIETGLKKMGAMIGDGVEVGCNSVLNPGTIVGKNTNIYPLSCVRGTIPENSILKSNATVVPKK